MSIDATPGGRCRCGAIRWEVADAPLMVSYCHCADCRRATGAPVTVFVGFEAGQVRFTGVVPARHSERAGIDRLFYRNCGSPIGYRDGALAGELYFYIGVMNAPERYRPQQHAFAGGALPWLVFNDQAPRHTGLSRPRRTADTERRAKADRR